MDTKLNTSGLMGTITINFLLEFLKNGLMGDGVAKRDEILDIAGKLLR